jgi:hypothetical protein
MPSGLQRRGQGRRRCSAPDCGAAETTSARAAAAAPTTASAPPQAVRRRPLKVKVGGLSADGRLPVSAAYCPPAKMDPARYNISPSVSWSRGPPAPAPTH